MMVHCNFHFGNESLGFLGFDQYKGVEEGKELGTLLLFKHSPWPLSRQDKQNFHTTWFWNGLLEYVSLTSANQNTTCPVYTRSWKPLGWHSRFGISLEVHGGEDYLVVTPMCLMHFWQPNLNKLGKQEESAHFLTKAISNLWTLFDCSFLF